MMIRLTILLLLTAVLLACILVFSVAATSVFIFLGMPEFLGRPITLLFSFFLTLVFMRYLIGAVDSAVVVITRVFGVTVPEIYPTDGLAEALAPYVDEAELHNAVADVFARAVLIEREVRRFCLDDGNLLSSGAHDVVRDVEMGIKNIQRDLSGVSDRAALMGDDNVNLPRLVWHAHCLDRHIRRFRLLRALS